MARVGVIKAYTWTAGSSEYKVFSKVGGVTQFLSGLEEIEAGEAETSLQVVGGHSRRAYPGAPPVSVRSHSRLVIEGGDLPNRTLPGQNAYFERTTGTGLDRQTTVTTVSFTGSFTDFHAYVRENSAGGFVLRSPDGVRYPIEASAAP